VHYKKGGDNINLTRLLRDGSRMSKDWDELNEKGVRKGIARQDDVTQYIEDGTYFRLREIALFYRVPLKWKGIEQLQIGASANNILTISDYSGYDPEVSNFGTTFGTGIDVAPYPPSKRLQLHLAVNF